MMLAVLVLSMSGCALHFDMHSGYQGPEPMPASIRSQYEHPSFDGAYTETVAEKTDTYTLRRITFASTCRVLPVSHDITLDYYDPGGEAAKPVILVLPILGGRYHISRKFAVYFARNGYAAVLVHRQKIYKDDAGFENLDSTLRQIVCDHRQVIDWVEMRQELDKSRIGVFGVSMGALKAALVSAVDPRVKASVLGLVAGDIPYIITHSDEPGVERRRRAIMAEKQMNLDEFQATLEAAITCDPMNYAPYMNAEEVLMILGWFDNAMPYSRGKRLWEKMGQPEIIYLFSGHITAYVYIGYVKCAALDFFQEKLGLPPGPDVP